MSKTNPGTYKRYNKPWAGPLTLEQATSSHREVRKIQNNNMDLRKIKNNNMEPLCKKINLASTGTSNWKVKDSHRDGGVILITINDFLWYKL